MRVNTLIIGQGISGTFLSYFLIKNGQSVIVIDDARANSPSRVAAGIINPVTGRRMVEVWMAEEIMNYSWNVYREIGEYLGINCISQKNIIDFFPNPFMRENFIKREKDNDGYLKLVAAPSADKTSSFNFEFGYGEIQPVFLAHLDVLLPAWRQELKKTNSLHETTFDSQQLEYREDGIRYHNIESENLIFCDGIESFKNPYFQLLPFAPNKGEALIVRIPGLSEENIYKKSMIMAPLREKDHFWVGSNYLWEFGDDRPSEQFRQRTTELLNEWLKIPFTIEDHLASVRPATLERRPFAGRHPKFPRIGILNGMGTKGCSLAPYFADQLCAHLTNGRPILPEADIARFRNVLSRGI